MVATIFPLVIVVFHATDRSWILSLPGCELLLLILTRVQLCSMSSTTQDARHLADASDLEFESQC